MHATTSSDNITTYSTAAGPSSSRRKFFNRDRNLLTERPPKENGYDAKPVRFRVPGISVSDFSRVFP
jgi:hypothetical protein